MSPLSLTITAYVVLGVLFAFIAMFADKKKGESDSTGSISEPALFWLYIAFWPVVALFRFVSPEKKEKKR